LPGSHALLADRLADQGEGLLSNLSIWHDEVRVIEIELDDLFLRHELIDLITRLLSTAIASSSSGSIVASLGVHLAT
jgi:hypothetical protein